MTNMSRQYLSRHILLTVFILFLSVGQPLTVFALGNSVDSPVLTWTTGGDVNWFPQTATAYDDIDAAQSGAIRKNQTSWIETTVTGSGTLYFYWKVSSEVDYDFLNFYINGVKNSEISGENDWTLKGFRFPEGTWTLRWSYEKNGNINAGADTGWLDQVKFVTIAEALDNTELTFSSGDSYDGNNFWFPNLTAYSGSPWVDDDGLRSGPVPDGHFSWLETTVTGPGVLFYDFTVSSEENYDFFRVYRDGGLFLERSGGWSGVMMSIPIGNETHTIKWSYEKDNSVSAGNDRATLDNVRFVTIGDALDNEVLPWSVGGEGEILVLTGIGGHQVCIVPDTPYQEAWVETTLDGPGTISFNWSNEGDFEDVFTFLIDGVPEDILNGLSNISHGYMHPSFEVPAGPHTLRWSHYISASTGIVCPALLDRVEFFPILSIDSSYPSLEELSQDLPVAIRGQGYNSNTRVSMFLENRGILKKVGNLNTPGIAVDLSVNGTTVYVADATEGVLVVDVSNQEAPFIVGSVDTPGTASALVVKGSMIYVADGAFGLQIIDASDLANPSIVGNFNTTGIATDVQVLGNYAYIADQTGGLVVVDISDPVHPAHVNDTPTTGESTDIAIEGQTLYMAEGLNGLLIFDISDPINPIILEWYDGLDGDAKDVVVDENIAFVAVSNSGLDIVDVQDPANPFIVGRIQDGPVEGVTVVNKRLFVAAGAQGVKEYDITDLENPILMNYVDLDYSFRVSVEGNTAYIVDALNGLEIIDLSTSEVPGVIGSVPTARDGNAYDLTLSGNLAFVAFGLDGLHIIDVSDPVHPIVIGNVDTTDTALDVHIAGNYAYVADGDSGLQIIDVSNPMLPTIIGSIDTPGRAVRVVVVNNLAYVADSFSGLQIIDISDPASPFITGSIDTPGKALGVDIVGTIAYVADGYQSSGVQVIDVSDPYNPAIISSIATPTRPLMVKIVNNMAYVSQSGFIFSLIDISDPLNSVIISTYGYGLTPWAYELAIVGSTVYLSERGAGIVAVDVTDPTNPITIGTIATPAAPMGLIVENNIAYVADSSAGLVIVPLPVEIPPTVVSDTELSLTLPKPQIEGHYTIKVFEGNNASELPGGVTFTDNIDLLTSKAIVVAGGGPGATGNIWAETKDYANYAYDNLIYQGYRHEDIYYLTDESGAFGRDASATKADLQYAISQWAQNDPDISDLLIYLVDHGSISEFLIRGGASPEYVTSKELDTLLDTVQSVISGKVIVVYDACNSGSFIPDMTPDIGKTRITITSSSSNQNSYFIAPTHSFSYHFWSTFSGKSGDKAMVSAAYQLADQTMGSYQTAQVDVNGNGIANEPEDFSDLAAMEGTIYALKRQYYRKDYNKPVVPTVAADQVLNGEISTLLTANGVYDINNDDIARVWAEISPPDFNPVLGQTVTDIDTVELIDSDNDSIFEGTYDDFTVQGTYLITYYAKDSTGISSLPKISLVVQTSGTVNSQPDSYENDDSFIDSQVIVPNNPTPQRHTFHDAGDADWVKFYALAGKTYKIKTAQMIPLCDTNISLYDTDGITSPPNNTHSDPAKYIYVNNEAGAGDYLVWTCLYDGIYYVRLTNNASHYGANVRYELMVYEPTADFFTQGTIEGYVTNASGGEAIIGADLKTTDNQSAAISQRGIDGEADGFYIIFAEPGTYTVNAHMTDFETVSLSGLSVATAEATSNKNFALPPENTPPVISGTPNGSVNEDSSYSFTPTVVDLGDTFSFGISGQPAWASFSTSSGHLSGTPNNGQVGAYPGITITVTDSKGATDSLGPFSITVNNINDAPTITSGTPPSGVDEDSLYSYTATADDIDVGDSVTLSITGKPGWAAFDPGTGILSGTPENDDVDIYTGITITATDLSEATASVGPFSISVANVNDRPIADAGNDFSANENTVVTLTGSATDPDVGDNLTLLWEQIGEGASVTINDPATATPSFTTPEVGPGGEVLTFQLTATDGYTASHSDNCTVTINWVAEATAGPDQIIDERDTTTLSVTGDPDGTISSVIWAQVGSGPAAVLADSSTLTPTITAPNVDAGTSEVLEFEVSINYDQGQPATDSCFVTVNDIEEDLDHDNDVDGSDIAEFGSQLDQSSNTVTIDQFSEEFGK